MNDIDILIERQEKRLEKAYNDGDRVQIILAEDAIELLEYFKTIDKDTKRHIEGDEQIAHRPDIVEVARKKTKRQWFKDWAYRRI